MNRIDLTIRPRGVLRLLLGVLVVLLVLHVVGMVFFYEHPVGDEDWYALTVTVVDLDEEESLGTWFSAAILLLAAVLLWAEALAERRAGAGRGLWWGALAVGFLLLSIDEVAGFHELLNTLLREGHWTQYGAALAGVCCVVFLPFLLRLPRRTGSMFMLAGLLYVGGAVGVEYLTLDYEREGRLSTLAYNLWNTLEEGLEMLGVILFLHALLVYRASREHLLRVCVAPCAGTSAAGASSENEG